MELRWPWLKHLFADGAYDRTQLMDKAAFRDFVIEVVRRINTEPGFKVLPTPARSPPGWPPTPSTDDSFAPARRPGAIWGDIPHMRGLADIDALMAPTLYERVNGALYDLGAAVRRLASPPVRWAALGVLTGDAALTEERADIFSSGLECQPSFAPGLRVEASYFDISYRDRVESVEPLPILQQGGVAAYFAGHDHAQEEYASQRVGHLFVVGAGGARTCDLDQTPASLFRSDQHGFGVLEITDETLTVQFINTDGEVIHSRRIARR